MAKKSKQALIAALARFGYPLLETETMDDPNELLASLVETADGRLLEGFPVVLANCLINRNTELDLTKVEKRLPDKQTRDFFWQLVNLSVDLFDLYGFSPEHRKPLENVKARWESPMHSRHSLSDGARFTLGGHEFDPTRLKKAFLNYVIGSRLSVEKTRQERQRIREELRHEFALSLLFSPKQKELLYKRLHGQPMTKTEREYFSRVVRKKLRALADPDLHRLAQKALQEGI
jgi:hypothetical protein